MIIEDNFFTKREKQIITATVLSNSFPWFIQDCSTSIKFPFFSHIGLARSESKPNSNIFSLFRDITGRFCKKHKIQIKKIHRHSLNLTYCFPKYKHTDPHVDHPFKHYVMMFYLNSVSGSTIIYNKKHTKKLPLVCLLETKPNFKILKKICAQQFKVACFDGQYFHASEFPKNNERRVVSIMTFN